MKKRFVFEMIVGIICLISVLLFGEIGMVAFTIFAVHPFIGKTKTDERESQLFNKVGNITAAVTLLASIGVYLGSDFVVNGHPIGEFWIGLVVSSFLLSHGIAGLVVIKG